MTLNKCFGALATLALLFMLGSCGSSFNYKEKTQEERKEEYHKELSTRDLSLFELIGNAKEVVYPEGFLQQYVTSLPKQADTVRFSANGACTFATLVNGDTLKPVRMTDGSVVSLSGKKDYAVMFAYNEENQVEKWTLQQGGASIDYTFTIKEKDICSVKAPSATPALDATIKILERDELGNWTKREMQFNADGKTQKVVQTRAIIYY